MAKLIPSFVDERTPPGERDVFNLIAAGPDEWVVLHALDLAPSNRGLRTEVDFVAIVPNTGILCIEVKSHEAIGFDGHRWYPATISRSPFKQAADARHTFYRRLSELSPQLKYIPVVHCCIFPNAAFDVSPNLSVQPWELMDIRLFRSFKHGNAFCLELTDMMKAGIAADANIKPLGGRISPGQIDLIVRCCVPVQKRRPDAREEIRRREGETEKVLLEQQKHVLRLTESNNRVIISGPAGTGKTQMAVEVARRAAEKGRRVALLCYNQLIGTWIKSRFENINPSLPTLIVGRTIQVLSEMAELIIPENPTSQFWEIQVPNEIEERLTDPDFSAVAKFDYLVLDEAQDILARPRLWACLTQFLSGNAENGSFAMFGDFDYQVLAERGLLEREIDSLASGNRPPVRWRLLENCRNYRIVGDTAVKLAGLKSPVYEGYLRPGGGLHNYDIFFYSNQQEQIAKLSQWLRDFAAQRYRPSEITILSFRTDQESVAVQLKGTGQKLRPAWQSGESTAYASVHAFKGMENKIVIITDVELTEKSYQRDLFYTALTRSTDSVRVLCHQDSERILAQWLSGKET